MAGKKTPPMKTAGAGKTAKVTTKTTKGSAKNK
jgi:hypothetical protein